MKENQKEEVTEKAQEKTAAKEKLEELKNMSADEAKSLAKEKAEEVKKLAAEKVDQMRNMSAEDAKKLAQEKVEHYKAMPMINKVSYAAAAVILLILLMSIFGKPSSPEGRAQTICEALTDGDFEEAVEYVQEKYQREALGLLMAYSGSEKNLEKMSDYDCSIEKTKPKGDSKITVYFENAPSIKMKLDEDGEWYWRM